MTKLNAKEAEITEWLAAQQEAMLSLLGDAVNIDSGSYDKAGVDAVGDLFIDFFAQNELLTGEPHDGRRRIHVRIDDTRPNESRYLMPSERVSPRRAGRRPFAIETAVLRPAWST